MLTTANNEGNEEVFPRIGSANPSRGRMSYGTLYSAPGPRNGAGGYNTATGFNRGMSAQQQYRMPVIKQASNLDENRVVLYKNSKQLGHGYYLVEISTNNTHLFIAAFDVESDESLLIELEQSKAQSILKEFQQDYELMASSL